MGLIRSRPEPARDNWPTLSFQDMVDFYTAGGINYPFMQTWPTGKTEQLATSFTGYSTAGLHGNAIVFSCINVRALLFSEARFQFQRLQNGRPGDLFSTADLQILEKPWPNGTTGDLLGRMEQDASLAGNSYTLKTRRGHLRRLRPDWTTIVIGSPNDVGAEEVADDPDSQVIGYLYKPPQGKEHTFLVEEIAHYAPSPDPLASWRGMSWLTPVMREIEADSSATRHKLKFYDNAATPNLAVTLPKEIGPDAFEKYKVLFNDSYKGSDNAWKTLFMGGGADVTVIGRDMQQLDYTAVQGAGETRIAAAAGVPAVVLGLSEGLKGSALNAGNYQQSRRRLVDGTLRPLWRMAAGAIENLVPAPSGARLWYDDRDIPFSRDDMKDLADVQQVKSAAVKSLVDAGYEPDSVIAAIAANDLALLAGKHTGLFSVQLQPPGMNQPAADGTPGTPDGKAMPKPAALPASVPTP